MAIKNRAAGPLSIAEIVAEFGGTAPHSLSEYYAGGANVPAGCKGEGGHVIPSSGTISIGDFYGAAKAFVPPVSDPAFYTGQYDVIPQTGGGFLLVLKTSGTITWGAGAVAKQIYLVGPGGFQGNGGGGGGGGVQRKLTATSLVSGSVNVGTPVAASGSILADYDNTPIGDPTNAHHTSYLGVVARQGSSLLHSGDPNRHGANAHQRDYAGGYYGAGGSVTGQQTYPGWDNLAGHKPTTNGHAAGCMGDDGSGLPVSFTGFAGTFGAGGNTGVPTSGNNYGTGASGNGGPQTPGASGVVLILI